MIALALLAEALTAPDPVPLRTAVEKCDRAGMAALSRDEPHRRAVFAAAVYDEQRAISAERAALDASPAGGNGPSEAGQATLGAARAALDARQRRLDNARADERAWRNLVEDWRADFLANCTGRRNADAR
ncbi:hypothetical protein H7F51_03520 [Novosphingobium flavum]|uniref:Uncharacterized protein n=1 Tax=Novosphingobium flavum TaxID=1778672 RepID=A0A7X1KKI9_9SPHN|nr:hypothetical protein [Novosphingobium flavum]MBC2664586.1 hypothetical protein [Novosphingobium flavum]